MHATDLRRTLFLLAAGSALGCQLTFGSTKAPSGGTGGELATTYNEARAIGQKTGDLSPEEIAAGRKHADDCRLQAGKLLRTVDPHTRKPINEGATVDTDDGPLPLQEVYDRCRKFDAQLADLSTDQTVNRQLGYSPAHDRSLLEVTEKLDGFSVEDSMRLDRVAEAYEQATPEMLMMVTNAEGDYRPADFAPRWFDRITKPDPKQDVQGVRVQLGRSVIVGTYLKKPAALQSGTVGLVWFSPSRKPYLAWFVTPDGERHLLHKKNLAPYKAGLPQPEPFLNLGLAPMEVYWLTKADALDARYNATLKGIETKFARCAAPSFKATKRKVADLESLRMDGARRRELIAAQWAKLDRKIASACGKYGPPFRKALRKAVKARTAQRKALLERAAPKVEALTR